MEKRRLEDLDLLDDFLFGKMMTYKNIGKCFIRELLKIIKIILKKEFQDLTIIPQKVYYGSDTDKHGARLDVYVEETAAQHNATIYDIEPDQKRTSELIAALPKRVRFYHAKIDAESLKSGTEYETLKNVIVIMITPYDPFGENRMIYTIRSMCAEMPEMLYDDGAKTLFLYTKGTEGNPPKEIRQLLHYMEKTTAENAVTPELMKIHQLVRQVKKDREVSLEYMKIYEREQMLIQQGRDEERRNTERERENAQHERENARREHARAEAAEKELEFLRIQLKKALSSGSPVQEDKQPNS